MVDLRPHLAYLSVMNTKMLPFCLCLLATACISTVGAEEAPVAEEKVIPTEVSEPPYEVGELVVEQGYYIDRGEEATRINFRVVGNKIRVYWIDADGLIAEPEAQVASVRLRGSIRGPAFQQLELLADDAGLGAPRIIGPPHIFNVILTIENPEDHNDTTIHTFRYTTALDQSVDPTSTAKTKSNY